ncbi:hypothetical protein WwAna1272 [Wolbachia endosymbiont of Drosophila ananassae]|nr:hypothetical protein WwAna1272 [Wolbachia endosymbiont of Drosophila ananassae]
MYRSYWIDLCLKEAPGNSTYIYEAVPQTDTGG